MTAVAPPTHEFILETVSARYGRPAFVFFFGSHAFGRGHAGSDVDVIVVLRQISHGFRETFSSGGFLFDAQVHDPETLHCMMRSEYANGFAVYAKKIDEALALPEPTELSSKLKDVARQILASAPPKRWDMLRHHMSAILSDLERCADLDESQFLAMHLYAMSLDMFLRSRGQFCQQGAYLVRSVKDLDAAFFGRAQAAVERLFQERSPRPLMEVARECLDSVGGTLEAGYRENYPATFRLALP